MTTCSRRFLFAAGAATAAAAAFVALPAAATPDAAVRATVRQIATDVCSKCHGVGGRGDNPRVPRIAAQKRQYLEAQLKAFRDRTRGDYAAHESMWNVAAKLSDDELAALADYFAAQPPAPAMAARNREAADKGRALFAQGSAERGLPACSSCHGANAEGNAAFPRLAGQHSEYLFIQLQSIRTNVRASPVMHGLIKDLTDDEIVSLAAFLESK